MKKNLFLFTALLALGLGYGYYSDQSGLTRFPVPTKTTATGANIQAENFTFRDIAGKKHALNDFRGTAVILNFWASWCAPCVIEFPQMLKLASAHKGNAVFLFLSQDESEADIKEFLNKYGKSLPQQNVYIAHDKDKSIAQSLYQTYKLPETYLIDSQGMIQDKIIGADIDWTSQEMNKKLQNLSR